jgi:hypothetical protein
MLQNATENHFGKAERGEAWGERDAAKTSMGVAF